MRVRALALAAAASLVALAGCGDDKDTSVEATTFCGVVDPVQDLGGILEMSDDTDAVRSAFTSAETAFAEVGDTPPEGIEADVGTVRRIFDAANTALKDADYQVDLAADADPQAIEDLESAEFQRAADNIQTWSDSNC